MFQVGPLTTSVGIGCKFRPPKVLSTPPGREDNDYDHEMNVSNIAMYKPKRKKCYLKISHKPTFWFYMCT